MSKALVITEKPSVARDITQVFDGFTDHDGYFENDDYVVTFAVGHLFELLAPEEVDEKFKAWTLEVLPILPEAFRYKPKKGQSERIRTIRRLLEREDVDRIVNACDAGREGELIFREIVDNLKGDKPVLRLWLRSMTDRAIREGFNHLRPGDEFEGLADSARGRACSDWLIGMNATRALTKRLKTRKEKTAWSAGRVQTPTLTMLVDRELEVLAHVAKTYWRIEANFEHAGQPYTGHWFDPSFQADDEAARKDDRLFDGDRAAGIVAAVRGQEAVAEESRKPSRESAPPLFDLTSLQREANRRFSWSARRTLSAAQRCYDRHKILTYPRTDSRCLPSDYQDTVTETLGALRGGAPKDSTSSGGEFADYARAAANLLDHGLENAARIFDDEGISDHFAIIPTGNLPERELSGDDKRLFDLVTRRFLGAFHPPARWERVERITRVGEAHFRTRARALMEPGWRSVLSGDGDEEARLPALREGESEARDVAVRNLEVESLEEQTKPLPRISEARLLSLMENAGKQVEDDDFAAAISEKGIGTPATRADTIENLIGKGYAVRLGKSLRPTVKGIRMIDTLRKIHMDRLTSPELTGEIEHHLSQVERGDRSLQDFMAEIRDYTVEVVERAKTFDYAELNDSETVLGACPSCGREVIEMSWFYRCREDPPREEDCPLRFWKDTSGRYIDQGTVRTLLRYGKTGEIDGFTARSGRTYRGIMEIDRDEWKLTVTSAGYNQESASDQPEYDVDPEPLSACQHGHECSIVESPKFFACTRKLPEIDLTKKQIKERREQGIPENCGSMLPRTVCKREITRDEALPFFRDGRTELLTDFTSRFGRPFSATLFLKDTGRHGFEFPPRKRKGEDEGADGGSAASASKKKTTRKKAGTKKTTRKKATRKKATRKKATRKKAGAKKTTRKKATAKKATRKKASSGAASGKKMMASAADDSSEGEDATG
ncbi:MAG: topoisomerase C-terminal repeat-containing protein [Myxococcales bacterium]|nr:topoisomerase C-terminal repeat-containing protein [Myxococcales bacterium]